MKKEKPLILLSNDDGVEAKGLNELIRGLRGMGEIIVMAPDGPRSGASGAITSEHPVKYYKVREEEDLTVYKCTGTPVDCVKLALHTVVPRRPDVVIGGINHGDNSSVNVHYSGTMGVVIEGCLKGISSIGYSLCNHFADADFSSSLPYIRRITEQVLDSDVEFLDILIEIGVIARGERPFADDLTRFVHQSVNGVRPPDIYADSYFFHD